jgi:probable F420-dependent oxidoreductase
MDHGLTFGISMRDWTTAEELLAAAVDAESAGFDVLSAPDHLGAPAPFQVLAAVATATRRVRLRTYVLDVGFWNPALLAREAATLDRISGGRVVLGVGAGHMKHEHDDARLPWPPIDERWLQVEAAVADVRKRLADPEHRPSPVQEPVPVMVAAMGERGLTVASRTADVVGLAGTFQVPGEKPGTFTLAGSEATDHRVELVNRVAGEAGREPEVDVLLQWVVVDEDPREAAERLVADAAARGATWLTPELLLDSPFMLLAESPQAAADELRRRAERWGIRSWSTHSRSADALAEVVAAVRAA